MWQEVIPPAPNNFPANEVAMDKQAELEEDFPQVPRFEAPPVQSRDVPCAATIRKYEDRFQSSWDRYVYGNPSATFFHLTGWKRVVERAFQYEPRYLFAEDDGKICGVLPLFMVSNLLLGKCLISTPMAVYGGICADSPSIHAKLRDAACQMAKEERVQYLELREQGAVAGPEMQSFAACGFQTKDLYVTFDLELPRDQEELLRGFPRDTRYMIRKAQKNGLRAEIDNRKVDTFYDIYCRSFSNLGTPVFPKRLFHIVLEEFGDQCELTTVWRESKAMASVLTFRFRDSFLPYFGGSLVESRPFAANNFMYFEVLKRALETGLRYFDFGRSKLGSGSYAFKTQWNMRERKLPYQFFLVRRKTMPNFSPANPKFSLAISLWKALPLPVTRVLGPAMVRAFP
jgi:FemAB-related protein (PEP-CTERM system-associated)